MPRPDPLTFKCPKCDAAPGVKCRNYRGQACAPHGGRAPKHIPNVQPAEAYQESEESRRAIAGVHAQHLARAVSACGWFPDAKYARWTFKDRTGARPDVVVYKAYRPHTPRGPADYAAEFPGHDEKMGPPFLAFYTQKPGDTSPGGFGFRWESSFGSIEVPAVRTAAELQAAAEKRRGKALAQAEADAAEQAAWKARNVAPSLFDDLAEEAPAC